MSITYLLVFLVFLNFGLTDKPVWEQTASPDGQTIQEAFDKLPNGGGTVYLTGGTFNGEGNLDIDVTPNGPVIIQGSLDENDISIIDCKGYDTFLHVEKRAPVSVLNITIRNCVSDQGGAIRAESTSLSLESVSFENNTAESGGALYMKSGSAHTLEYLSFFNNSAHQGGAVSFFSISAEFYHTEFVNNTAEFEGGAIFFEHGSVKINYCDFEDNSVNGTEPDWTTTDDEDDSDDDQHHDDSDDDSDKDKEINDNDNHGNGSGNSNHGNASGNSGHKSRGWTTSEDNEDSGNDISCVEGNLQVFNSVTDADQSVWCFNCTVSKDNDSGDSFECNYPDDDDNGNQSSSSSTLVSSLSFIITFIVIVGQINI